jgi:hypothetical protein
MAGKYLGGGPKGEKGFPAGDKKHMRLAIGGATRSYNAGNISKATKDRIQSQARARLKRAGGNPADKPTRFA